MIKDKADTCEDLWPRQRWVVLMGGLTVILSCAGLFPVNFAWRASSNSLRSLSSVNSEITAEKREVTDDSALKLPMFRKAQIWPLLLRKP